MAATFALTNCTKDIENPSDKPETAGIPFEIIASTADTKTTNDGLNTNWAADDAINLFHAEAGATTYGTNDEFTITSENLASNKFTGELTEALAAGKTYDWYALYPYNVNVATPGEKEVGYTYIGYSIGLNQTGYDSMASLKGSVCPLYGVAKAVPADETPNLVMEHLSSVVAIKITNANDEPLTVTNASFTATEDIVGSYFIDITKTPVAYTAKTASETATVNVTDGATPLAKGESATLYLAIKPFTAPSGETLTLSVNGYSKTITLPKDVTFSAGKIKTLKFSYDKPVVPSKTWSLVQNIEDIYDGEYVVLATTDMTSYGYLPVTTTSSNPLFTAQTVLDPSVAVTSVNVDDAMIWNVKQNPNGTFTFKNSSDDYFYGTNAAQGLRVGSTEDSWIVSAHPTNADAFAMKSVNGTRYVGVYNTDWRSYSTSQDTNYDATIDDVPYDGLKSQLYFFYCGTIPVKTKLSAPTGVIASVQNLNQIVVTWNAVANAGSYDVTCGDVTINTTSTTCTFTDLDYNTDYVASVKAKPIDNTTYYSSDIVSAEEVTTDKLSGVNTYLWTLAKNDLGTEGSPESEVNKGDSPRIWNLAFTWANEEVKYLGFESSNNVRGLQIGKADKSGATNHCDGLSLTTTDFGAVNSIKVNASIASGGNTSLSVTVGGQHMICGGNESVSLTNTTPNEYTFITTTALEGDIIIKFTNTGTKGFYLKSISINK